MSTIIILIFLAILFEIVLSKLKKAQINSLKFIIRILLIFIFCIFILKKPIEIVLKYYIFKGISLVAHYFDFIEIYEQASLFIIHEGENSISIFMNYECLGMIEHILYTLVILISPYIIDIKKLIYIIVGNIYILNANIIRILTIFFMVRNMGIKSYNISHMIFGRLIFFIFILILYFYIFTRHYTENGGKE